MQIYGLTDTGRKREENQDALDFFELTDGWSALVVCDGMGGAAGGATASNIARQQICDSVRQAFPCPTDSRALKNLLISAISAANISVFDHSLSQTELQGMGTTAVVALVGDGRACIAHVGDSRAYLYLNGALQQLTTDHSIVQLLLETGQITLAEAQNHPKRNIITRALGVAETVEVDFIESEFSPGALLLLCTDGLTNYASVEKIVDILEHNAPQQCPQLLIDAANEGGGGDNITVAVAANQSGGETNE